MGRFIGLDIGARHVRAALLATRFRRVVIERLEEAAVEEGPDAIKSAITTAASHLVPHIEGLATAIDGELAFVHRLLLPPTAMKQLAEVLPFELEAQVPVDLDELTYDYRALRRERSDAPVAVIAAAARIEHVRARIDLVRAALGREPDRIACGPMALANLVGITPALRGPSPIVLVDLGGRRTEVTVLARGEPVWVRTLSRGVEGLPEAAVPLAAELRQTLLAFAATQGTEATQMYLVGGGALAEGACEYLAHELGIPVELLPALEIEAASPELLQHLPRFAKAISLALGAAGRGHDVDLRRGSLALQRGFGFLKEKAPVLIGLGAATAVSFAFSTWAEARGLSRQNEVLVQRLAAVSKIVLEQEVADPESALSVLEKARAQDEPDPQPEMDAFDVVVEISKAIPMSITHDIEEFDMQRGHVKIQGVVGSAQDAQAVATELGKHRCVSGAKIGKITQVVNSDRQKYALEFDVRCPDESKKKKKPGDTSSKDSGAKADGGTEDSEQ
ncbi:MAG: pilus assembly protein PilM [Pseudomonadota bacterium]|nr:MAG: general secretion pathway protein GspL [Pseudomonadota bacterium]